MEMRPIGRSGLTVAPLAFGGNVFGWTADEKTSFALLDAFVGHGCNLIDTADAYSTWVPGHQGGESEAMIGRWLNQRGGRDKVVIASKVGMEMGHGGKGLSRNYILSAVDDSLRRLQTDYIDLYFAHKDDPDTPLEETLETFAGLIKAGKVRAIGASNYSAGRLIDALRVSQQAGLPRYECVEPEYNLYDRAGYEQKLEPVCAEHQLGVICYFALASGFLTGKYRSEDDLAQSARGQMVAHYMDRRGLNILKTLDEVAERYHTAPASVALAWIMARPSITAPIASATSLPQLQSLIDATQLQLDAAALAQLDQASAY